MGKLALLRFSEFINAEYGAQGIMAFSVHPGGVRTELAFRIPRERYGCEFDISFWGFCWGCLGLELIIIFLVWYLVLIDTPEMAANTIVYLTQQRREWLMGRYVSCTWDMPELFAMREEVVRRDLLKVRMAV